MKGIMNKKIELYIAYVLKDTEQLEKARHLEMLDHAARKIEKDIELLREEILDEMERVND